MYYALSLLLATIGYRLATLGSPVWGNFSPLMAVMFCGAVYLSTRWLPLVVLLALSCSDLAINAFYAREYGYSWDFPGLAVRTACFAAAWGLGSWVATRRSWATVLGGSLAGSLLFYLGTNTVSWAMDPFYARSLGGWWQALTVGHPEFAPTWWFFRNTLASDLGFTLVFAGLLEWRERRAAQVGTLLSAGASR